ncbi:RNA polymerase sigma factor (sigma-70 family) [Psychromicrobium silvestre]|uniref:RNA polymerase sigma factor (Sigma-70 family) n=1 Tax=Psychromicrobium silvestre TaxID=1645614 RepID=A0A7Y9LSA7_9MICC|nr:RNA polymerase sigma factor (sigma-70 family) [Psychromicrobium silvestre]
MSSQKNEYAPGREKTSSDAELITLVKAGQEEAFDELYRRHHSIALAIARQNVDTPSDAEDIAAEAFAHVLAMLKAGSGPENFFRAYLLTVVTRTAHRANAKNSRIRATDDEQMLDVSVEDEIPELEAIDSRAVAEAFQELPERWRATLWYIDVEGQKPASVGVILGISANAVSSLAGRARDALRSGYLQKHVQTVALDDCRPFANNLGSYVTGSLRKFTRDQVTEHLSSCSKCTALLVELSDIRGTMRRALVPAITGLSAASYQATAQPLGFGDAVTGSAVAKSKVVILIGSTIAVVGILALLTIHLFGVGPDRPLKEAAKLIPQEVAVAQTPVPVKKPLQTPTPSKPALVPVPAPAATTQPPVTAPVAVPVPVPTPTPTRVPTKVTGQILAASTPSGSSSVSISMVADGTQPLSFLKVELKLGPGKVFSQSQPAQASGWSCSAPTGAKDLIVCTTDQGSKTPLSLSANIDSGSPTSLSLTISGTGITTTSSSRTV